MAEVQRPWLKFRDKQVPVDIDFEVRPMAEFLADAARKWPGRNAVVFRNFKITYAGLDRAAGILARQPEGPGARQGRPGWRSCCPILRNASWPIGGVLRAGGGGGHDQPPVHGNRTNPSIQRLRGSVPHHPRSALAAHQGPGLQDFPGQDIHHPDVRRPQIPPEPALCPENPAGRRP